MDEAGGEQLTPDDVENQSLLQKKKITRRQFLAGLGAAAASLALGRCLPFSPAPPTPKAPPATPDAATPHPQEAATTPDPQERFRELGMEAFWPFYSTMLNTTQKLAAPIQYYFLSEIPFVCQQIAEGKIKDTDDPILNKLRDGWGERKNNSVEAALAHIQSIDVIPDSVSDNPETVKREQLTLFARAFAPMALALPPELDLNDMDALMNPKYMLSFSFAQFSPAVAWFVFFHESTHAVDIYFDRIKSYISQEKYLNYLSAYFRVADELLTDWFNQPNLDSARNFWTGFARAWGAGGSIPNDDNITSPLFSRLEEVLFGQEFVKESAHYRITRIGWTAGRKIQTIQQKKAQNEQLTAEEQSLLNNPDIQTVMSWILGSTVHFLVGPPENAFDPQGKPFTSAANLARIKMNDIRVKTFATFPLNPNKDTMEQVRKQLGIN